MQYINKYLRAQETKMLSLIKKQNCTNSLKYTDKKSIEMHVWYKQIVSTVCCHFQNKTVSSLYAGLTMADALLCISPEKQRNRKEIVSFKATMQGLLLFFPFYIV